MYWCAWPLATLKAIAHQVKQKPIWKPRPKTQKGAAIIIIFQFVVCFFFLCFAPNGGNYDTMNHSPVIWPTSATPSPNRRPPFYVLCFVFFLYSSLHPNSVLYDISLCGCGWSRGRGAEPGIENPFHTQAPTQQRSQTAFSLPFLLCVCVFARTRGTQDGAHKGTALWSTRPRDMVNGAANLLPSGMR